jgi:hypothetical protein
MATGRKVVVKNTDEDLAQAAGADSAEVYSVKDIEELLPEEEEMFEADSGIDPSEATTVEELADDVEIFEDGPTAGSVKSWKKMYGEVYVTSISFDKHIVWRVLSRIEYKQLANMWNEEAISELCILFPQYDKRALTEDMAGLPSLISQEVLEASGFVALEVRQL